MRPEEKIIMDGEELQELQEKFCKMHHIYSVYLKGDVSQEDMIQIKGWKGLVNISTWKSVKICFGSYNSPE